MNRKLYQHFCNGLFLISTNGEEKPTGCIINNFIQLTNAPPFIAISVNKLCNTHNAICSSKKLAISSVSQKAPLCFINNFGNKSNSRGNKFTNYSYELFDNIPVISDYACATMLCELRATVDFVSHTMFICEVFDILAHSNTPHMTNEYYSKILKGHIPSTSPSYSPITNASHPKSCSICGYIFRENPNNCPICGNYVLTTINH